MITTPIEIDTMQEIVLEKLFYNICQRVSSEIVNDVDVSILEDAFTKDFIGQFRTFVWAEDCGIKEIKHADGFWQEFKRTRVPKWRIGRWFLNKWPVRYTVLEVNMKALFPKYKPSIPNEEYSLRWIVEE
jgi:hypothetical protein